MTSIYKWLLIAAGALPRALGRKNPWMTSTPRIYRWLLIGACLGLIVGVVRTDFSADAANVVVGYLLGSAAGGALLGAIAWGVRQFFIRDD
jgi:hypothetical protein